MVLVIVLIVLIVGSVLFHFLSPWYLTPIASNWGMIDDTLTITFIVCGFVFVAINLFMVYAIYSIGTARTVAPNTNQKIRSSNGG